ncbi:NitT/TauT family transport system substrate-binding protein [Anaerovirgula multivorans]|uniref:NitT/TauT family transport system substrate-binding protein n=1 Tax=Anaerovirgula multivorans TaxID=312168 RepID=A0A239FRV0_9FIRM|nr:MqnA/MqnD/SBP family protein [Anaerovirgula multivorans]SNS58574.1 NitT/TauT family transport system substrate-binding protein [Anaerovirgula multivorans]
MKKLLRKSLMLLLIMALLTTFVACSKETVSPQTEAPAESPAESVEKTEMRVAALNGPTGMGMVELMERNENGDAALDYDFTLMGSPDDLAGKIISGEVDVAAVPTNLALVLHNRTEGKVQLAAVNTLGVLYVVENGDSIHSVTDLKGKTINISGKGATPDFIFQYILQENQLEADKDVMLDFKLQHAELAAFLAAGDVDIALLPQPHVTTAMMKNENLRIALDITEEWRKVMGSEGQLAMGAIVVQKEFAEENKEALDTFLEEYERSVNFVNQQMEEAAMLIEKYEILPNVAIARKAIPYSNIVYIDAQEAKPFLEDFYQVLFNFEPKSIGGKLGDEGFYYKK